MLFPTYYSYGSSFYSVTDRKVLRLSKDCMACLVLHDNEYKRVLVRDLKNGKIGKEIEEGVWLKAFELFEQQLKKIA